LKLNLLTALLMLFALPGSARAEEPIDALNRCIDRGIQILTDPRYSDESQKEAQQEELVMLFKENLDLTEFSRLVLAVHWPKFSQSQRQAFEGVLGEFLGRFYMRKLQKRYKGENVRSINQRLITDSKAVVSIAVTWKDLDVPVQVRMVKRDGVWRAYDAIALGISFMRNYRAQFDGILRQKSPEEVIEMLEEKTRRLEQKT